MVKFKNKCFWNSNICYSKC